MMRDHVQSEPKLVNFLFLAGARTTRYAVATYLCTREPWGQQPDPPFGVFETRGLSSHDGATLADSLANQIVTSEFKRRTEQRLQASLFI